MPRLSFPIDEHADDSENYILDFCSDCWEDIDEDTLSIAMAPHTPSYSVIAELLNEAASGTGEAHPSYDDDDYECCVCEMQLFEVDD